MLSYPLIVKIRARVKLQFKNFKAFLKFVHQIHIYAHLKLPWLLYIAIVTFNYLFHHAIVAKHTWQPHLS